jgi:hypothetical protein
VKLLNIRCQGLESAPTRAQKSQPRPVFLGSKHAAKESLPRRYLFRQRVFWLPDMSISIAMVIGKSVWRSKEKTSCPLLSSSTSMSSFDRSFM